MGQIRFQRQAERALRATLGIRSALLVGVATLACSPSQPADIGSAAVVSISEWPVYGGDPGGQRFAEHSGITRENVDRLAPAWTHHTGDFADGRGEIPNTTAFQNTPILVAGTLYGCSPFNRVFALDPVTGRERWRFDPGLDLSASYANQLVCRGVASWRDPQRAPGEPCAHSVFMGTNDARLIAIDANTGTRCPAFGRQGEIDLASGAGEQRWKGEYQVTSPPLVIGDVVVVGSAVADNVRIDAPSGVVRGFDGRTGALRWAWDLAPPGYDHQHEPVSREGYALGTPNVWAPMSADPERDLLFVPTGNAAPDYYSGERVAMDHYGSSVVALRGSTGEVVWHFQAVHNDLWDFDTPAQPTLTHVEHEGELRPALVQATKMGLVFVLDRETGEPLFPVDERPVPMHAEPGERPSPTQPFPSRPPMLVGRSLAPDDAWGLTPWDRARCRERIEALRFEGMYTPPSVQGTLMYPGNAGGSNWGGVAVDPVRRLLFVRSTDLAWVVRLIPREAFAETKRALPGREVSPQTGTPFGMHREMLLSPLGLPCNPPPWGTLSAIDLRTGDLRWQVPHGTTRDLAPIPIPIRLGVPGTGGPIATPGGIFFIAAALDDYLRAYDSETGRELWKGRLPAGGQATPMTYRAELDDGRVRDFVVIAAGGHARAGSRLGDALVAFAVDSP